MSRAIIKNRKIVEDNWLYLADEDSIPGSGSLIVTHQRWLRDRDSLKAISGNLGVIIGGEITAEAIKEDLECFQLVAVHFPVFKDGRGYTYARMLRERYGYRGELRAIGNILRDQIFYLHRCGFDAFELEQGRDIEEAISAFQDFGVSYQPAAI